MREARLFAAEGAWQRCCVGAGCHVPRRVRDTERGVVLDDEHSVPPQLRHVVLYALGQPYRRTTG